MTVDRQGEYLGKKSSFFRYYHFSSFHLLVKLPTTIFICFAVSVKTISYTMKSTFRKIRHLVSVQDPLFLTCSGARIGKTLILWLFQKHPQTPPPPLRYLVFHPYNEECPTYLHFPPCQGFVWSRRDLEREVMSEPWSKPGPRIGEVCTKWIFVIKIILIGYIWNQICTKFVPGLDAFNTTRILKVQYFWTLPQ